MVFFLRRLEFEAGNEFQTHLNFLDAYKVKIRQDRLYIKRNMLQDMLKNPLTSPGPGQLLGFADSLALDPAEIIMVGDSTHDLLAAQAAGMRGIGVLTGPATADELGRFATAVLLSVGELPEWIERQNLAAST